MIQAFIQTITLFMVGNRIRGGMDGDVIPYSGRVTNILAVMLASVLIPQAAHADQQFFLALVDGFAIFVGQAGPLGRIYGAMVGEETEELKQGGWIDPVADRFLRWGPAAWGWAGMVWRGILWTLPLAVVNTSWALFAAGLLFAPVYYFATKLSEGGRRYGWARSEWFYGLVLGAAFAAAKLYGL